MGKDFNFGSVRERDGIGEHLFLMLAEEETVDHLLLPCKMTQVLWHLLFSCMG